MVTLTIVRSNPGIQRKGISDISGKSISTIDRHLAILVKEGLIEHRDSDKTGGDYVKMRMVIPWPPFCHLFDVLLDFVVLFECINKCKTHNYK